MNDVSISEALDMLTDVSGVEDVSPQMTLQALHLDSLQLVEWVSLLEEKLDVDLDIRQLNTTEFEDRSISDILDMLKKRAASAPSL
ncbi:MAG TPA: acyl carrier protein [Streptosporangiaceae bacterium]|jgi:acyl carrier protein